MERGETSPSGGDFSQFERMVGEVSNPETARLALRWALERLHGLEASRRELAQRLRRSEETEQGARRRVSELEAALGARERALEDREGYHRKLEQTIAALSEGRADLAGLLRRELESDKERQALAEDYRKRVEELDRAHREASERWARQLSEAGTFVPQQLSGALQRYDELRRQADLEHQQRLTALEQGFRLKEEELLRRRQELEDCQQARMLAADALAARLEEKFREREAAVESAYASLSQGLQGELATRRQALEAEFLERGRRLEEESRALGERLRRETAARLEAWQEEQGGRLAGLEKAWELERKRLLEEQGALERRLGAALSRVGELQEVLAASDVREREDLAARLSGAEAALRRQLETLEAEGSARKAELERAYGERVAALQTDWENRCRAQERAWEVERRRMEEELALERGRFEAAQGEILELRRELERRRADADAAAQRGEAARLEQWELRREELGKVHGEHLAALQRDWEARGSALEKAWEAEKGRLQEEIRQLQERFEKSQWEIRNLREASDSQAQAYEHEAQQKIEAHRVELERRVQELEGEWVAERTGLEKERAEAMRAVHGLQEQLHALRGSLSASALSSESELEALRDKLEEEHRGLLKEREEALERTHHARLEELKGEWGAERAGLEKEREEAEGALRALQETAHALRENLGATALKAEADLSALRARVEEEHRKVSQEREAAFERAQQERGTEIESQWRRRLEESRAEWTAERARLEEGKAAERARLQEEAQESKRLIQELEERVASMQERLDGAAARDEAGFQDLRERLDGEQRRALEAKEKFLERMHQARLADLGAHWSRQLETKEEEWSSQRAGLERELGESRQAVRSLQEQLQALREGLGGSALQTEAKLQSLRQKLDEEYRKLLKEREEFLHKAQAERESGLRAAWEAEKGALQGELGQAARAARGLRERVRELEEKMGAASATTASERQALEAKLKAAHAQTVRDLQERVRGLEEKLGAAMAGAVSERQALGTKLQMGHALAIRALEEGWEKERGKASQAIGELQERVHALQESLSGSTLRSEAEREALRARLEEEHRRLEQEREQVLEKRHQARLEQLQREWAAQRAGLEKEREEAQRALRGLQEQAHSLRQQLSGAALRGDSDAEAFRQRWEEESKHRALEREAALEQAHEARLLAQEAQWQRRVEEIQAQWGVERASLEKAREQSDRALRGLEEQLRTLRAEREASSQHPAPTQGPPGQSSGQEELSRLEERLRQEATRAKELESRLARQGRKDAEALRERERLAAELDALRRGLREAEEKARQEKADLLAVCEELVGRLEPAEDGGKREEPPAPA